VVHAAGAARIARHLVERVAAAQVDEQRDGLIKAAGAEPRR
jgi:hypothetical protein